MDVRLLLPATAGWLTAVLLLALPWWVGIVTGPVAAGVACGLWWRDRRGTGGGVRRTTALGVAVVVAAMGLICGLHVRSVGAGPVPGLAASGAAVTVELVVTSDPVTRESAGSRKPPYVVLRGRVEQVTGRGRTTRVRSPVLVVGSTAWAGARFGARVKAKGRLKTVDTGSDVAAVLTTRSPPHELVQPAWWLRAAEHVRAGLRESVHGQPEAVRGLVPALVMGDDAGLPAELNEDFKVTGLTHLAAVSGTNLTLLLAFVIPLARITGVRARGLTMVGLVMVVVFVVLARPQPSVLRAAAMGVVALVAMTSGGRRRGVRSLSAAVLVLLLLDVSLARSAGFSLSVLATAGIVILAPGWRDTLARRMPGWIAEAVACPLAAQLACTPVVAWLSGQVSLVAVAANLLAGPAVGPATVLGFVAAGVALLSDTLARVVGWFAAWPARWIVAVAEHGAGLPGAVMGWPATVLGIVALTLLCAGLVVGMNRLLVRPIAGLLVVALLVVVIVRPVGRFGWPPPNWLLVACDVGQGDGLAIRAGPGSAVVVDTGPDPGPMDRCLRELGIKTIPVLVITHFHADHAGGLAGALRGRSVGEIEVTAYPSPPAEQRRVLALAAEQRVPVRTVSYGERRIVGPVSWTVLWPARVPALPGSGPLADSGGSPENNSSIAMLLESSGVRILMTGDLEPESQRAVLASGSDTRADVLKVPHHGSSNQDETFLRSTGAKLAVVSAGIDNDYGHPAPSTLDLLRHLGMTVARTDTGGSIAIVRTPTGLALATSGPPPCPTCRTS
jgi:competence protein ComEC